MASLFGNNNDYESIPLLETEMDLNSHNNRHHGSQSNSKSSKKTAIFAIVFVIVVMFALFGLASRQDDNNNNNNNDQKMITSNFTNITTAQTPTLVETPNSPAVNITIKDLKNVQNIEEQGKEEDEEEEETESNDIETTEAAGITGGGRRNRNRRRRNRNNNNKNNNAPFDLSILKEAVKASDVNPFNIDYTTFINKLSKNYTTITGDLDGDVDYSQRIRTHLGHENADQNDVDYLHALKFWLISDTHIDPYFNPMTSSQQGVCSPCKLNSKIYGESALCPLNSPFIPNVVAATSGYAFGRLRCNPPPSLMASLLAFIRKHQQQPAFILITGDIGAHGMASDTKSIDQNTKLTEFCPTKFLGMRATLTLIRELFPQTPILFAPGNNDHLPKNVLWEPYFEALAALLLEFNMLHPSQASTFRRIGSHFVDLEADNEKYKEFVLKNYATTTNSSKQFEEFKTNTEKIKSTTNIRVILPDMTLLAPGGEASFVPESEYEHLEGLERENVQFPRRRELIAFMNATLYDAEKNNRYVFIAGHQPLTTKKGINELLITTTNHGILFKALLAQYAHIIKGSFWGHRNLATIQNILSPSGEQIIPQLVVPGVSPRGNNLPAIQEISISRNSGKILDFEQYVFDLLEENERAQLLSKDPEYAVKNPYATSDMYADSGRVVIDAVMNSRINDKYDPTAYQKHLQSEQHLQEKRAQVGILTDNVLRYGIDCNDDQVLCDFVQKWGYLGYWIKNPDVGSWRKMTGYKEFTAQTVAQMNARVPTSARLFTALQVFKRAGFIGDSTVENVFCNAAYDDESAMMKCLFPEQDETEGCFAKSWLK